MNCSLCGADAGEQTPVAPARDSILFRCNECGELHATPLRRCFAVVPAVMLGGRLIRWQPRQIVAVS